MSSRPKRSEVEGSAVSSACVGQMLKLTATNFRLRTLVEVLHKKSKPPLSRSCPTQSNKGPEANHEHLRPLSPPPLSSLCLDRSLCRFHARRAVDRAHPGRALDDLPARGARRLRRLSLPRRDH